MGGAHTFADIGAPPTPAHMDNILELPDLVTIPFRCTVAAGATTVFVSSLIDFPYDMHEFQLIFELNTNRTVQVQIFVANDNNPAVATGDGSSNLFGQYNQSPIFVGDDQPIRVKNTVRVRRGKTFLKLRAVNNDGFSHALDAWVTVRRVKEFA